MCNSIITFILGSLLVLPSFGENKPVNKDPYRVIWDEVGQSADDNVPLGNGEIGLNAWVNPDGTLEFFISRTDSWDEWGRQVKVGALRIMPQGDKPLDTTNYTQTLDTTTGILTATIGKGKDALILKLWVDAERPVIVAEIESPTPIAPKVASRLWRVPGNLELEVTGEVSPGMLTMQSKYEITPDTILPSEKLSAGQIGWYHLNGEKPAYAEAVKTQGMEDYPAKHPFKDCIFGAIVQSKGAQAVDPQTLQLPEGKTHLIEILADTLNPSDPEKWLASTQQKLNQAQESDIDSRRKATSQYWQDLQDRSYIRLSKAKNPVVLPTTDAHNDFYNCNKLPLSLAQDQGGGSGFLGTLHKATVKQFKGKTLLDVKDPKPAALENSSNWTFPQGGSLSVDFTLSPQHDGHRRLFDKITVGSMDGFLLDITPDRKVRLIQGGKTDILPITLEPDKKTNLTLVFSATGRLILSLDGKEVYNDASEDAEDAFLVSQAYALQRYVTACGGRGNLPITFNGSIFTVPVKNRAEDGDYRRWGSGYWWQNTRLPYYAVDMAGDFEMMRPLVQMYMDILPHAKFRTKKYTGADGAYFPECIYHWGEHFPRSYGAAFADKQDKIQDSGYHKYEWDSGIEISCMALDHYLFTQDEEFVKEQAIPLGDALIRFFNTYYKKTPQGELNMFPSQALETWWDCTNPASEVAGLLALTRKLLALPKKLTTQEQRQYWTAFQKSLPPIPVDTTKDGERKLCPATRYEQKANVEVPELYAVFPYRICSFDNPKLLEEAKNALKYRWDRGPFGWRQEDLFMAYLGLTQQAKGYLLSRVKNRHHGLSEGMPKLKFPGYWGPGYDWLPDQCHGGVIASTTQRLVMQTSGEKIFLFPAFPAEWNAEFKLHAPYKTIVEGKLVDGKVTDLKVTPESRRKDVIICNFKK